MHFWKVSTGSGRENTWPEFLPLLEIALPLLIENGVKKSAGTSADAYSCCINMQVLFNSGLASNYNRVILMCISKEISGRPLESWMILGTQKRQIYLWKPPVNICSVGGHFPLLHYSLELPFPCHLCSRLPAQPCSRWGSRPSFFPLPMTDCLYKVNVLPFLYSVEMRSHLDFKSTLYCKMYCSP